MSINREQVEPQSNLAQLRARTTRAVRIGSLLLFLQSVGLSGVITYYLTQSGWTPDSLFGLDINLAVFSLVLVPLILLTLIAAIVTLFSRLSSWIFAMLVQGLILYVCLDFYFSEEEPFWVIYPIMFSAVFMVFYLDSAIVKNAFYQPSTSS